MIVSGSHCLFTPVGTGLDIGYIIRLSMIFDGVGRIIQWFTVRKAIRESGWALVAAIISLALGIVLSISSFAQLPVDLYIAYMAAFWMIALGILRIFLATFRDNTAFGITRASCACVNTHMQNREIASHGGFTVFLSGHPAPIPTNRRNGPRR